MCIRPLFINPFTNELGHHIVKKIGSKWFNSVDGQIVLENLTVSFSSLLICQNCYTVCLSCKESKGAGWDQ